MKRFHTLRREQWVPRPLPEVFEFFANAQNLAELTPPWLGFRILTPGEIHLATGTLIRYRIGLHGIPVRWTTQIRRWEPPFLFTDVQLSGPYRLWHHTHRFEACKGGTHMKDIVRYRLPFGWLGRVIQATMVRRDLEKIFDYRFERVQQLLGSAEA